MLENSFYTIEKKEIFETSFCVSVALNASHEIYAAHFPGNPITPGVCLLQIALELIDVQFGRKHRMVAARNVKYLKIISPIETPTIEYAIGYKEDGDLIQADITIKSGDTVFTKVNATYKG